MFFPMQQVVEVIIELVQICLQARSERIDEPIINLPAPRHFGGVCRGGVRSIPQERVQQRTGEHIADVCFSLCRGRKGGGGSDHVPGTHLAAYRRTDRLCPVLHCGADGRRSHSVDRGRRHRKKSQELSNEEEKARLQKWCFHSRTGKMRRYTDPTDDPKKAVPQMTVFS